MADPITIFGSIAAAIQITSTVIKLSKVLMDFHKTGEAVPKDIRLFAKDVSAFSSILKFFQHIIKIVAETSQESFRKDSDQMVTLCVHLAKSVFKECKDLVSRFKKSRFWGNSSMGAVANRVLWSFNRPDVAFLRLSLDSARNCINVVASLLWLESAIRRNEGADFIASIRSHVKVARQESQQAKRKIREYSESHSSRLVGEQQSTCDLIVESSQTIEHHTVRQARALKLIETSSSTPTSSSSDGSGPGSHDRTRRPPPERQGQVPVQNVNRHSRSVSVQTNSQLTSTSKKVWGSKVRDSEIGKPLEVEEDIWQSAFEDSSAESLIQEKGDVQSSNTPPDPPIKKNISPEPLFPASSSRSEGAEHRQSAGESVNSKHHKDPPNTSVRSSPPFPGTTATSHVSQYSVPEEESGAMQATALFGPPQRRRRVRRTRPPSSS